MPDDKSKISADDINLFRDSVKGTRQLKQDKVRHKKGQPAPRPRQTQKDEQQVLVDMMSDEYVIDEV
jgi:DNA-nicking Smr family endonuclease